MTGGYAFWTHYEQYDPGNEAGSPYAPRPVRLPGPQVDAWVYLFAGLTGGYRIIDSGGLAEKLSGAVSP